MTIKSRRLRRGVGTVVALAALTACASEKDDSPSTPASASATPTPTGTPTTTPDQIAAFCSSLIALDTAILSMGPPGEKEEEASTGPSAAPSATVDPAATSSASEPGTPSASGETAAPTAETREERAAGATGAPAAGAPPAFPDIVQAMTPVADRLSVTKVREVGTEVDALVGVIRQAIAAKDREMLMSEEYFAADAPLDAYGIENCGYKQLEVTGVDYEFDNAPSTASAGPTAITLKNEGKEFHEVVLLRINEGVTESVDEILALPQDQIFSRVTLGFVTVVPPGRTGTGFTDLKAGKYAMVCFIPKGTKPGAPPEEGAPPHFAEGMIGELVVS